MSSLQEHLENTYDVDVEEQMHIAEQTVVQGMDLDGERRFVVDDEDKAEWGLRKLERIQAEFDEVKRQRDEQLARIEKWFEERANGILRQQSFFEGLLNEYHRNELRRDPDRKTIKLPSGRLSSRRGQPRWNIDEESFMPWAEEDPERAELFIRITKVVNRAGVKSSLHLRDDGQVVDPGSGELVPGVLVDPAEVNFYVEVGQ